ncbi:MAG TPA: hypothetical protein VKG79_02035 [Bryobacteraceae bacterium]|nr:hypothetical protein [Bryobacteraceae bacterium]
MRSTAAIVRNAFFVVSLALVSARGDAHSDAIALFGSLAAALTDWNVPAFMDGFDEDMPGFDNLKTQVTALVNQAEVTSSIEPVTEEGDDSKYKIDLDWFLQVRSLLDNGPIVERRQVIHCQLRKEKKKWKIVSLEPIEFFAPAKVDK